MEKKLKSEQLRQVIQNRLQRLINDHPDHYYSATSTIARLIHEQINEELSRLSIDDQLMLKPLTVRDIEMILSIK